MLDLNPIFSVFKVYHIKVHPQLSPIPPLPSNSSSSHIAMIDSPPENIIQKTSKYQLLIDTICEKSWSITPLMVITTGVHTTTHIPSMILFHYNLNIPNVLSNKFVSISTTLPYIMPCPYSYINID